MGSIFSKGGPFGDAFARVSEGTPGILGVIRGFQQSQGRGGSGIGGAARSSLSTAARTSLASGPGGGGDFEPDPGRQSARRPANRQSSLINRDRLR